MLSRERHDVMTAFTAQELRAPLSTVSLDDKPLAFSGRGPGVTATEIA